MGILTGLLHLGHGEALPRSRSSFPPPTSGTYRIAETAVAPSAPPPRGAMASVPDSSSAREMLDAMAEQIAEAATVVEQRGSWASEVVVVAEASDKLAELIIFASESETVVSETSTEQARVVVLVRRGEWMRGALESAGSPVAARFEDMVPRGCLRVVIIAFGAVEYFELPLGRLTRTTTLAVG